MVTKLRKPLDRRIGDLIVRITDEGLLIRGHRKRTWHQASWEAVASAVAETLPITRAADAASGEQHLKAWGAVPEGKVDEEDMAHPKKRDAC